MKQLLLFITLLSVSTASFAQADSIYVWNKWCSRKDTLLLFNSGNNIIQIYSRTLKPADFKVKSLDKSLRIGLPEIKGDTMNLMAMPFPEKGKIMRLAILSKKTSKTLRTVQFTSDSIPMLMAKVGNIQSGEANRKDILAQTVLKLYFPKSLYSYPYSIQQYTFKVTTPKGSATFTNKGIFLTKEVLQEINNAPVGTTVEFVNIKATCPDCATRNVQDIKLKIK